MTYNLQNSIIRKTLRPNLCGLQGVYCISDENGIGRHYLAICQQQIAVAILKYELNIYPDNETLNKKFKKHTHKKLDKFKKMTGLDTAHHNLVEYIPVKDA